MRFSSMRGGGMLCGPKKVNCVESHSPIRPKAIMKKGIYEQHDSSSLV